MLLTGVRLRVHVRALATFRTKALGSRDDCEDCGATIWFSFWAWLAYDAENKREVAVKLDHAGNFVFILILLDMKSK